jgi:MFS family permease
LAILVFTNNIEVWQLLILSLFLGIVSSFDIPVRQAFTIELIDKKEDMGNAIALNSSIVNLARLIGPSIAGILIAVSGEAVCFLCNAISYIPAIAALLAMKIVQRNIKPPVNHVLYDLKEGFMYAFNVIPIRAILLLLCLVSLMAVPYQVLMPVFARDIFHGGPKTLGYLMAMAGAGALAGAMYLASRKSVVGLGKIIAESSILFGVSVAVFSFSRWFWLSMIIICVAGFSMMVQMAASNTILQTIVEEDKRGRIMSFYTMAFIGMAPFGSLLAGGLANKIGVSHTLLIGGVCSVIGAIIFTRKLPLIREKIRPIYVKKGIIPEVAAGIGVASELEK